MGKPVWSARVLLLPLTLALLFAVVLGAQTEDLHALMIKGMQLDSQKRYSEAETYYRRALELAPNSAAVLNNLGNHYLASGDKAKARSFYLKALALDPHHANANLQLAQMSVEGKDGKQALMYVSRVSDSEKSDPAVLLLKARALALSGQCAEAAPMLGKLADQGDAGPEVNFSIGMACAQCKLYSQAERSFSRALEAAPTNFDVLYNLGLASLEAGHADRATSVLESALKQRPEDPDCQFALARSYVKQQRFVNAAALLAKARKLAPGRADIVLLLAQVSARLEFFQDAAATYDEYLKLKPGDDVARRERGFTLACANQFKSALSDLQWYVRRHPRDAVGFYELAVAKAADDRRAALQDLDHAVMLDPELMQARYARALLNIEEENPAPAVEDLRLYVEREPKDYRALAHLGQAYLALGRAAEAADVLSRAVDLAPNAPLALIHYRRALVKLGRQQEARAILSRLKQPGLVDEGRRPQAGLIEYLSLAPSERRTQHLANLRRSAETNPGDPQWSVRLGRELLAEGQTGEGLDVFRKLKSDVSQPTLLARCGKILLEFGQYDLALQFLEQSVAADPSLSASRLDLAIARFHLQSPQAALQELDQTPAADRKGDYYLLRAQVLDSLGRTQEAVDSLNRGMRAAPTRSDLYLQAAGFLLKHNLLHEALDLLDQSSRILPDDRELLLAQAVTLELLRREVDAQKLLAKIQARWPEWERAYQLSGILFEIQLKSSEARQMLETAIALGANTPEVYYYEALAITHANPDSLDAAQTAINHALALTSKDPYAFVLAGKIALAKKEYTKAVQYFVEANRLLPTLVPAHYGLRDAYKALGEEQKSAAEMDEIKRLARENQLADQNPFAAEGWMFAVLPPG
jgi:tetratricopeptide (TPR) repeat protein